MRNNVIEKEDHTKQHILTKQKSNLNVDGTFKSEKNLLNSKKIYISRYLFNKLINFFNNLISNLDANIESKKIMFQIIELVKSEESSFSLEQNKENEKYLELKNQNDKLRNENENFKKNQNLLNDFNTELTNEVFILYLI